MNSAELKEKRYKRWITILSIIIPVAVAALFGVNLRKLGFDVEPLTFLPPIYATVNGFTAVLLVFAVIAIKKGNKALHEKLNTLAIKYIYYFILITHIILSVIIIPFVLITLMRAKLGKFPEHKKIAKITFPLWLYVAVTGVIVYLMISPYYV